MGICGADVVRVKIALALWDAHAVFAPDDEMDQWETVAEVIRSVLAHAERQPGEPPMTEDEALSKVRQVIADGWDVPTEEIHQTAKLFEDGLALDGPDRFRW